ncbi:TPA: hypothetical protein CPT85_01180 [Candidatus Gastranaerophilales bacterium HUM_21]|nr:MAG TPA: hypothetical protein CPT85_01180 [Candidatus Gastranaerophilales bacterium HUM_21]
MLEEDITKDDLSKIQTTIVNLHSLSCLLYDYSEYNYPSTHMPEVSFAAEIMKEKCREIMNLL